MDPIRRLTPTPVSGDGPELYDKRGWATLQLHKPMLGFDNG
jgi:hypothetical protein